MSAFEEMLQHTLVCTKWFSRIVVVLDEGLALGVSICSHLIAHGVSVCFSSQWRELTSQVEALEGVAVPKPHGSVSSPERRRTDEDRR